MSRPPRNWFGRGADAFERVSVEHTRCYVCPICGTGFLPAALDAGLLTREHAPPKALGGRPVALTCRDCNSRSGHQLDDEMRAYEHVLDFVAGTMPRPVRARYKTGGRTLNINVQAIRSNIQATALPSNNNPDILQAHKADLDRMTKEGGWENYQFSFEFSPGFRHREALLGWLRSAYLVAFAVFGYRYALSHGLRSVRQQLADTKNILLNYFSVTIQDASPDERRILIIEQPTVLRSLTVQMGRHLVFLPSPLDDSLDLYERLEQRSIEEGGRFHEELNGKLVPWPKSPELALDFL